MPPAGLVHSLDSTLSELKEVKKKVEKLKPLKSENKELLKLLLQEQKHRRQLQNKLQELSGNIRVLCRIRPPHPTEKKLGLGTTSFKMMGSGKVQLEGLL